MGRPRASGGYHKIESPEIPIFGKTLIAIGKQAEGLGEQAYSHAAVYLGKSKDGTEYVWTKNKFHRPFLEPLNANKNRFYGGTILGMYNYGLKPKYEKK